MTKLLGRALEVAQRCKGTFGLSKATHMGPCGPRARRIGEKPRILAPRREDTPRRRATHHPTRSALGFQGRQRGKGVGLGANIVTNKREIPADKFFLGLFETALKPG